MKVLIMPANNADDKHVQVATNIIEGHGHEVVRWHYNINDSDFDTAIIIPGDHNKDVINDLWIEYCPQEDLEELLICDDIFIGKGLYSFIHSTNKTVHLMLFPIIESCYISEYSKNEDNFGPGFICFDRFDLKENDSSDYKLEYARIDLSVITDRVVRKYHEMSQFIGFEVEENEDVEKPQNSKKVAKDIVYLEPDDDSMSEINLLLLRRLK